MNFKDYLNFHCRLDESKSEHSPWSLISDSDSQRQIVRFKGKTFPLVIFDKSKNTIFARNDNGPKPSATYSLQSDDPKAILAFIKSHISGGQPAIEDIQWLLFK